MAEKNAGKAAAKAAPKSMPKDGRDPKGGLTAKGRAFFAARDGSHLKPGVTGPARTPEEMLRKGSFLVRTFTHPRGPMLDKNGEPTRLALSAHAWGEKVPGTVSAAHTLAAKGHTLLARYHAEQEKSGEGTAAKKPAAAKPAAAKPTAAKPAAAKPAVAKKTAVKASPKKRSV